MGDTLRKVVQPELQKQVPHHIAIEFTKFSLGSTIPLFGPLRVYRRGEGNVIEVDVDVRYSGSDMGIEIKVFQGDT